MGRVLITGASGFVGQHLCRLIEQNGQKVVKVDRTHGYNILDSNSIFQLVRETQPEAIYHLAGFSSVNRSWDNPAACFAINVEGTRNIMEAAREARISGPILVVSSSETYGQAIRVPTTETTDTNPVNPYGESRVAQEDVVKEYEDLHWIISRSYGHIGPGQGMNYAFPSFASRLLDIKGRKLGNIMAVGAVDQFRDISDVRDIVKIYHLLTQKAEARTTVNVCSGIAWQIRHTIEQMAELIEVTAELHHTAELDRPKDTLVQVGSTRLLHSIIGPFDRRPLADTLTDVIEYVLNERR